MFLSGTVLHPLEIRVLSGTLFGLVYYQAIWAFLSGTVFGWVYYGAVLAFLSRTVLDLPEMGVISRTVIVLSRKSGWSEFKFTGDPGAVSAPAIFTWGGFSARKPDPILNMNMKYKPT